MSTNAARTALASLPRNLKLSAETPVTRTHLVALYREQLRVAHSFASYNFRQYFLRRTRDKFRTELPSLLDAAYAPSAASRASATAAQATSTASTSGSSSDFASSSRAPAEAADDASIYSPSKTPAATDSSASSSSATLSPEQRLREWYAESLSELAVMARSAIVNRMYEAPRLVVEGVGRVMTSGGGGAGAEARFSSLLSKVAPVMHKYNGPTLPTAIQASKSLASTSGKETAIFANGCFWGTEHMFRKHFSGKEGSSGGLIDAKVGYIGGNAENPSYRQVCTGSTNHAEACKIDFDPSKVSYAELVEFHYRMHDPTQVNRQGPDVGTQYRSAIYTTSPEQEQIAKKVTGEVQQTHYPKDKIATTIEPAGKWWDAEDYHQEYLHHNPSGYECPSHILHW
ncbi:hypothetical protein OIV83_002652 [Microbotryomycetes sp. JL201]|nr:hypothetical protein OIV83_002652 [Microbotryomycetes sp. JL201]